MQSFRLPTSALAPSKIQVNAVACGVIDTAMNGCLSPEDMDALRSEIPAVSGYAGLTEAEKEKIILRCKGARTKRQMQEIVESLAPGTDVQEVFEEEKEQFS